MRIDVSFLFKPHFPEQFHSALSRFSLGLVQHMYRSLDHIFEGCQVRKQVKALKHEADLGTHMGNGRFFVLNHASVHFAIPNQLAVDINAPAIDLFEMVDAAQQRRLTGTAWPDNHHELPTLDSQVDAIQDRQMAKSLDDLLGSPHLDWLGSICLLHIHTCCSSLASTHHTTPLSP